MDQQPERLVGLSDSQANDLGSGPRGEREECGSYRRQYINPFPLHLFRRDQLSLDLRDLKIQFFSLRASQ
ncbi:hypothetical protein D3C87_655790 [compost metagenome]